MTTFNDRETAFENKFVHDADLRFRAEARAVKTIAQWAAALLGRPVDAYAADLIAADFKEAGQEDVVAKLIIDLAGHVDEATIRARFAEARAAALREVTEG